MGQIKWYKRDPERALNGMMSLTLDERGAYNTVLDLLYFRDGKLPDDDRFLAGYMGVDVRVWRRIKTRLIGLGKLSVIDGMVRDDVADVVLAEALRRLTAAQDAGNASAAKRAAKSDPEKPKNNELDLTDVEAGDGTTVSTNKNKSKKEIEPDGSIPPTPQYTTMSDWPDLPEWLPVEPWNAFIAMRKRKSGMPTARAVELMLGKLERWRASGQDPGAVLDQSTEAQWTGIFELKDDSRGTGNFSGQPTRDSGDGFTRAAKRWANLGDAEGAAGEPERSSVCPGEGHSQGALALPEGGQ
jgi:uncharacterized protein YdaU (DUF1376 family)